MLVCVMIMGVTLCVEAQATPFAVGSYVKYYPTQTKVDLSALTGFGDVSQARFLLVSMRSGN